MGIIGFKVGRCCVAGSLGRRSYPLSLFPSPHLLTIFLSALSFILKLSCLIQITSHIDTAGVRGTITRFVITIPTPSSTYHFYELDVQSLESDWLECNERRREWVDYAEAVRRLEWKAELSQGLKLSSLAPSR